MYVSKKKNWILLFLCGICFVFWGCSEDVELLDASALQSVVSVFRQGGQPIEKAVQTKVEYNYEMSDSLDEFDSVNDYHFAPDMDDEYLVTASIYLQTGAAGDNLEIAIRINGSTWHRVMSTGGEIVRPQAISISSAVSLVQTDILTIIVTNYSSNDVIISGHTDSWLQITRLH